MLLFVLLCVPAKSFAGEKGNIVPACNEIAGEKYLANINIKKNDGSTIERELEIERSLKKRGSVMEMVERYYIKSNGGEKSRLGENRTIYSNDCILQGEISKENIFMYGPPLIFQQKATSAENTWFGNVEYLEGGSLSLMFKIEKITEYFGERARLVSVELNEIASGAGGSRAGKLRGGGYVIFGFKNMMPVLRLFEMQIEEGGNNSGSYSFAESLVD